MVRNRGISGKGVGVALRVASEWQHREVGERVFLHPTFGLKVMAFEPEKAIVLEDLLVVVRVACEEKDCS